MYSRVTRLKVPADKIELAIQAMQGRVDAGPQRHEAFAGFAGEMLLVDREGQEAMLVAYYQDKASMDSTAEAARQLRDQVVGRLGAKVVSVNEYEIAVADIPSPITTG
ncbi:MAG: hypothetical protein PVSMB3_03980 [Candidatus Dormibacteraceae bacterium]